MKKLFAILVLTATASMLNADYVGSYDQGGIGRCPGPQPCPHSIQQEGAYAQQGFGYQYQPSQYGYQQAQYGYEAAPRGYSQYSQYDSRGYSQSPDRYAKDNRGYGYLSADRYSGQASYGYTQSPDRYAQDKYSDTRGYGYMSADRYSDSKAGYGYTATDRYAQDKYADKRAGAGYGYDQGAPVNDQQLTKDVQDSLRSVFSDKYNNVNATVKGGTVTLTGTVASQDDKKDLEEKVRDISGVRNVDNQVRVQEKPAKAY